MRNHPRYHLNSPLSRGAQRSVTGAPVGDWRQSPHLRGSGTTFRRFPSKPRTCRLLSGTVRAYFFPSTPFGGIICGFIPFVKAYFHFLAPPRRGNKVVRLTGGREFSFSSFVLTKEEKETKRRRKTTRGGLSHVVAEPAMARAASVRPHSHGSLLLSPRGDSRAGAPPLWTSPFKNDQRGLASPHLDSPGERPHAPRTGRTPGRPACRFSYFYRIPP